LLLEIVLTVNGSPSREKVDWLGACCIGLFRNTEPTHSQRM